MSKQEKQKLEALVSEAKEKEAPAQEKENEEAKKEKHSMSQSKKRKIVNTVSYITLSIICVVWVLPFIFLLLQSFRVESFGPTGYIFPRKWGLDNYAYLFGYDMATKTTSESNFLQWYINTFIIALSAAVGQTIMQIMMAYALSRFRFRLRKPLMNAMLILGMFPGFLTMIVLYQVLKTAGVTGPNAVPGLIIVSIASSGMGYYIVKGFLDTMPKSLDEAAMVDGATRFQVFYKVILPLCKPIVIYTVLTSFMGPWGDFVFASTIALGAQEGMNVAAGLYSWLDAAHITEYFTRFCAGGVLVAIPVMVLFMFLQKYYVEGVTGGAVKG